MVPGLGRVSLKCLFAIKVCFCCRFICLKVPIMRIDDTKVGKNISVTADAKKYDFRNILIFWASSHTLSWHSWAFDKQNVLKYFAEFWWSAALRTEIFQMFIWINSWTHLSMSEFIGILSEQLKLRNYDLWDINVWECEDERLMLACKNSREQLVLGDKNKPA